MLIKVCGLKYAENIAELSRSDIDLAGFIFYQRSKRFVERIPISLPKQIKSVGVFVNKDIDDLIFTARNNDLDYIQLHGDEDQKYCFKLKGYGFKIIKVFRIDKSFDFKICGSFSDLSDFFLFDTKADVYGGTGKKFSWEILNDYKGETPFLLSGGISPEDHSAVKLINHNQFAGIDLNSKFEKEPALKDISKINIFIKKVRTHELF